MRTNSTLICTSYGGDLKFIAAIEAPALIEHAIKHPGMHAKFVRLTVRPSRDRLPFGEKLRLKPLYTGRS